MIINIIIIIIIITNVFTYMCAYRQHGMNIDIDYIIVFSV